ncbi:MAG: VWA domain-containing protein [Cyanobacteria bacterium HKST-UBA02]|nr:VWA domain-containing protein [Cyanobacteria bacterium HKST-UBA02]
MTFENLTVLWWMAAIPPLALVAMLIAWRRDRRLSKRYGDERLYGHFSEVMSTGRFITKAVCLTAGAALLVVALGRPVVKHGWTEFPHGKVDVITLVDVSRSMAVPDYKGKLDKTDYPEGRRLDMARHLILTDIVPSLNYNRLGVVTYSGTAMPLAFLTDDMLAMNWMLRRAVTMGSVPGEGSEMGKAFELAIMLFDLDSSPDHRKVIVLFSDGGNDADQMVMHQIVNELQKRNIELVVVGLGKPIPSPIPIALLSEADRARYNGQEFYEHEGQVVTSRLEANSLLLLRNMTGGRYVQVTEPSDFSIGRLISNVEVTYKQGKKELFPYALMGGFAFLFLTLLVPRTSRRRVRER